jgi:riboflavin biosynthesis pyrimidine reductase
MRSHAVTELRPLEVFFDASVAKAIPLPPALERAYGRCAFPLAKNASYVIANFVETLDGVVSLGLPGKAAGGPISGSNQHDRLVMGLLRSVADAVVVGSGTLRSVPQHVWTAEYVFPALSDEYTQLRSQLGKPAHPLNVIVSGSGELDAGFTILEQTDVPVHILTTTKGAKTMGSSVRHVDRTILTDGDTIPAVDILRALTDIGVGGLILLETGPQLTGQFLAEGAMNELFLTLAPQVAGRDADSKRPGLVSDRLFAPDNSRWAELVSVRRGDNHLFLRYSFDYGPDSEGG